MSVQFDGLPVKSRKAGKLEALLSELASSPGYWAVLSSYPTPATARTTATRLRKAHSEDGFQFATRKNTLYGRKG